VAALRRVMVELRPPALDEWGLVAALGDHAATFRQQTGIDCTVEAELPVWLAGPKRRCCTGSSRRP
jgi:signal transduction histidine kinase